MKDDGLFIFGFYAHETKLNEIYDLVNRFFTVVKLEDVTENAINSAFISADEIKDILENQIRPGYEKLGA